MITLLKIFPEKWEQAKGYLRLDLEAIEAAMNQRWSVTFGASNLLNPDTIQGWVSTQTRYVSNEATDPATGWPMWAQVNLANGVKNRLPFSNFVAATAGSKLVGRGSGAAGDFEEISLGPGLVMQSTTLSVDVSGLAGRFPIPDEPYRDDPWPLFAPTTAITYAFTPGSVIFAGATGDLSQDNSGLFFDSANDRLGIGVASPADNLDVRSTTPIIGARYSANTGFASWRFYEITTLTATVQFIGSNFAEAGRRNNLELFNLTASGSITFHTNNSATAQMTLNSSGVLSLTTPLAATSGGTGLSTFTQGDLIYSSAANTLAKLAKDTNATRYLSNTGGSNNPAWAQVNLANGVTGTLPVANGGTGTATAFTAGSIVFAGASGVYSQDNANLFWDDTTNSLGIGTTPGAGVDLDIIKSVSGGQVAFRVRNSSNTATSDAVFIQSVGGSSAGDAYFSMSVTGATTFACGIDNSDSDKWKIAASGSLGSSDALTITTGRIIAMPVYGAGTATFDANGVISSVSDERLKTDITLYDSGLRHVLGLRPIAYRHTEASGLDTRNIYVGFSAQNVMKFIPGAVGKSADVFDRNGVLLHPGRYSVNDRPILAAVVNAIQTLQAEIDVLRARLGLPALDRTLAENIGENGIITADPQIEDDFQARRQIEREKVLTDANPVPPEVQ